MSDKWRSFIVTELPPETIVKYIHLFYDLYYLVAINLQANTVYWYLWRSIGSLTVHFVWQKMAH